MQGMFMNSYIVQTFILLFNEINESNDNNTSIILLSH